MAGGGGLGFGLEGGELGYSLSTSYGAVLDNPDLIVTCLVGDGEAENEVPGWDISFGGGTISGVIDSGLQMMWDEGPGGGHYENMNSSDFTELGCGIYVTGANQVWVVLDFA